MKQRDGNKVLFSVIICGIWTHKCFNRALDEMYTEWRWDIEERKILQSTPPTNWEGHDPDCSGWVNFQ